VHAGNIWLHFGPSLLAWVGVVWWVTHPDEPHAGEHYRILIPALVCLMLSTCYHMFMAQVRHYRIWLTLDVRTAPLHRLCSALSFIIV
jgi:predicted membrane channel-forming protein YqfA (hemolysin III family)